MTCTIAVTGVPSVTLAVTGASGFVGQMFLETAMASGHRVQALTRRHQPARPGVTWVEGTLADTTALDRLVAGADVVVHIAGAVNVPSRAAFAAANIDGTRNMVDAATRAGARRFVHVSSLAARMPDLSNYGWSKAEAEKVVQASSLCWAIVRPPGVYGPRDTDMLEMFRMARRGYMLLPPAGRGSWIHVTDLAQLLLTLVDGGPQGVILEPDDGTPLSHREMAAAIGAALGRSSLTSIAAPRWLLKLAGHGDRLVRGDKARLTPDRAAYMSHPDWVVDTARAPDPALWAPKITITDGFASTADWYRRHGWID